MLCSTEPLFPLHTLCGITAQTTAAQSQFHMCRSQFDIFPATALTQCPVFARQQVMWKRGEGEPKEKHWRQTRQSCMLVFISQWCTTPLSHPADCLLGVHAQPWWACLPHRVLSLPSSGPLIKARKRHTHTHTVITNSISARLYTCSWSWDDRIHREDPINVYLLHCYYHFTLSHVASARQYINYFQCHYGSNQLQPL